MKSNNVITIANIKAIHPEAVSTVEVDATCNKCLGVIKGVLIGDLYSTQDKKVFPLIVYSCAHCGHKGRRSVFSKALPPREFDRKYYGDGK